MELKELNLPAFAMLNGCHDPSLGGRTVILHVRSASVIEIFNRLDVALNPDVLIYKFKFTNLFGIEEHLVAALHYCATLDVNLDAVMIKEQILKPAAKWYYDYAQWEDSNILEEGDDE